MRESMAASVDGAVGSALSRALGIRRRLRLGFLLLVPAPVLLAKCGEPSPYDDLVWSCGGSDAKCVCRGVPEEVAPAAGPVRVCSRALDCCFVTAGPDGATDCTCVASETSSGDAGAGGEGGATGNATDRDLACHRTALDHGSTEVVALCPPITLDSAGVCALAYEACDQEYLESIGVVDCCEGTHCAGDASGVQVCQPD